MKAFHCITFTHKNIGIDRIGDFHIAVENQENRLSVLKKKGISELLFLSTCNRVELWVRTEKEGTKESIKEILYSLYPKFTAEQLEFGVKQAIVHSHIGGVNHAFRVTSSLESLVIGEREILSQFRDAYHFCRDAGFTGDFIRLLYKKTVEVAKRVYTDTNIATRPVSVVNLAYQLLRLNNPLEHANVLIVGSGKTNQAMIKKLAKVGYNNFSIYNRTYSNAIKLSELYGGKAFDLKDLKNHDSNVDVLVTCTSSENAIIDSSMVDKLTKDKGGQRIIVIDLAVPADVSKEVQKDKRIKYIAIEDLKEISAKNIEARKGDLEKCEAIIDNGLSEFESLHKARQVEIAMRKVPQEVKEIRKRATEVVYAKEIAKLDATSRETLEKVLSFVEKKYMSAPMRMAKEILLQD